MRSLENKFHENFGSNLHAIYRVFLEKKEKKKEILRTIRVKREDYCDRLSRRSKLNSLFFDGTKKERLFVLKCHVSLYPSTP